MSLDMSKYLDLFVQEATEHLEAMGQGLPRLERGEDEKVVDELFRHAHSVKGMAASMGFTPIAELAHHLEDLMDLPRSKQAVLDPSDIDLALQVVDGLSTLVAAAGGGRPLEEAGVDDAALGRRLAAARARHAGGGAEAKTGTEVASPAPADPPPADPPASAPEAAPAPSPAPTPAPAAPPAASARGKPTLRVSVQVAGSSKVPGVRGFLVHKRLAAVGEILRADPSLPDLKAGRLPENRLEILLATDTAVEAVEQVLSTIAELERVKIDEVDLSRPRPRRGRTRAAETLRTVRIRTDLLDGFMDSVGELLLVTERIRALSTHGDVEAPTPLDEAVDQLASIAKALHGQVLATRMIRLATLTDRLPRVVRDAARSLGKQVSLTVEGADIELDRAILDELDAPITHLLRNSIDHGLEDETTRIAAGKPVEGRLRLDARRDRDRVVLEISDDGRGFDRLALKSRAIAAGHLTERAADALSDRETLMLSCLPGLTTAVTVSDLSGRGVGMDVVKAAVEGLGGTLEIESTEGAGTTFILRMPLTVAIQRLLLVRVGGETVGVPVAKVLHVTELDRADRSRSRGKTLIPYLDGLVPVSDLSALLEVPGTGPEPAPHLIFEGDGREPRAVAVDGLAGHLDAVIKPLGRPLDLVPGLSGVTLLPDGRPLFVVDLASLTRSADTGSPL